MHGNSDRAAVFITGSQLGGNISAELDCGNYLCAYIYLFPKLQVLNCAKTLTSRQLREALELALCQFAEKYTLIFRNFFLLCKACVVNAVQKSLIFSNELLNVN